jgi:drug/metabolite transporter (DMT)-like permease
VRQGADNLQTNRVTECLEDLAELDLAPSWHLEIGGIHSISIEINARRGSLIPSMAFEVSRKSGGMNTAVAGAALATTTGLAWGGQFVIGKSALGRVDAFPLTTIRYGVAALALVLILLAVEGRSSLRLGGRGARLAWLGTLGFAGFNLLAYTGLAHAQPQSAALIVALGPLLTALVLWLRSRIRPARSTIVALAVALFGVALVISRGDLASIASGAIGWGDVLVLGGVISFVLYTLGAAEFDDFSPLRFTALTATFGFVAIAVATVAGTGMGLVNEPTAGDVWAIGPQLLYITFIGAVLAVVTWNAAVGAIGPQNTALFGNLIPVTTFAIEIVRGYRPHVLELVGAALTIGALVASNLFLRRRVRLQAVRQPTFEAFEEEAQAA